MSTKRADPSPDGDAALRRIPSVEKVLRSEAARPLLARHPRWAVTAAVRRALAERREEIRQTGDVVADEELLLRRVARLARPSLRRVINATGVVLHTNLGRAPLSPAALAAVADIGAGYSTLE